MSSIELNVPVVTGLLAKGYSVPTETHKSIVASPPVIDMLLTQACTHNCVYCASLSERKVRTRNILDELGAQEYLRLVLRLAGTRKCRYSFGGPGECAEHPAFGKLLHGILIAGHRATIQTHGLTSRIITDALHNIDSDTVRTNLNLHLSFHYGTYLHDPGDTRLKLFLHDHFPRLAGLGCPISLITPLTPGVLESDEFSSFLDHCARVADENNASLSINPIELHGAYDGRRFPNEYTIREKELIGNLIRDYSTGSRKNLDGNELARADVLYLKGMPCYAPLRYTCVHLDGTIRHCYGKPDDNFRAHLTDPVPAAFSDTQPVPCPYERCLCIGAGISYCLDPLGIPMHEYLAELKKNPVNVEKLEFHGCRISHDDRKRFLDDFIRSFLHERIMRLLAEEKPLVLFPAGAHTRWLLYTLRNSLPTKDIIVLNDPPLAHNDIYGFRCLSASMKDELDTQRVVLSTDIETPVLRRRAGELFAEVVNLYEGLPPGPYTDKCFLAP